MNRNELDSVCVAMCMCVCVSVVQNLALKLAPNLIDRFADFLSGGLGKDGVASRPFI